MIVIVIIAVTLAGYAWYKKDKADRVIQGLCYGIIDGTLVVEENDDGTYNIVRKVE